MSGYKTCTFGFCVAHLSGCDGDEAIAIPVRLGLFTGAECAVVDLFSFGYSRRRREEKEEGRRGGEEEEEKKRRNATTTTTTTTLKITPSPPPVA